MDRSDPRHECPDCEHGFSRRDFIAASGAALAAASLPLMGRHAVAAPSPKSAAETAVKNLYESLTKEQQPIVALPFDEPRRTKISANWHITKANVESFSADQQELIDAIFKGVTSGDGYERFMRQMDDDSGGFKKYSVAIFGDPNNGPFEFELTGRHHTIRADGNSVEGAAFGGPIVYGHSKQGNSPQNLFSYQTKRADEVFKALDGKQRESALLEKAPNESAVQLRKDGFPGISCGDLAADQKELVSAVLRDIMQPYRQEDVDEVMEIVKAGGGMDQVRIAFYKSGDLDNDEVWDVWRLEGPTLVCHFRGAPHVHAYINIAKKA